MKKYTILCTFLATQMIASPFQIAWAQSATPQDSANSRIAVVEVHDGKIKPQKTEQVAAALRDAMARLTKLSPVLPEEVNQYIRNHPELTQRKVGEDPYDRYLAEAREHFNNFDFKTAEGLLEKTTSSYRIAPTAQALPFKLTDAYWLLGYVYLSDKNEKLATQTFQEAIRLNPREEMSERDFPPSVVELYRKLRVEYLEAQKSVTLDIDSNVEKTNVYLNGKYRGQTPLRLESMTPGEHFIVAVAEGFLPQVKRLEVTDKDKTISQDFKLSGTAKTKASPSGFAFDQLQDIPTQVEVASNLAEGMNLDKVVLVSLEERGWNYKITTRMVDRKYRASYKQKAIEVVDLDLNTPTAVAALAKDLDHMNKIDLAKDPERYAEGDIAVLGRKRKKPIYKKAWFWSTIGGVVLAGGAAGALLAGRGGDGSASGSPLGTSMTFKGPNQALSN